MSDFDDLRRVLEPIVPVEHAEDGLLTLRFRDGTRLSFLCGPSGRLNVVTVQHGPATTELRLPDGPATHARSRLTERERAVLDMDPDDVTPATQKTIHEAEQRALERLRNKSGKLDAT